MDDKQTGDDRIRASEKKMIVVELEEWFSYGEGRKGDDLAGGLRRRRAELGWYYRGGSQIE